MLHQPVLLKEVLEIFNPRQGENYIDATVNGGGHALAILERVAPAGRVLGIDWDETLLERLREKIREIDVTGLELANANYADIEAIADQHGFRGVQGILFDLGFSSYHVDEAGRGFSFMKDEPLDMRYRSERRGRRDEVGGKTAENLINHLSEKELEKIFREHGEERYSRRIARRIVEERRSRPIKTTKMLVDVIWRAVPAASRRGRIHPATRVFQALRIAVNDEWGNIEKGIGGAINLLKKDGHAIAISFHSGEDRIVKRIFREAARRGVVKILTGRPARPTSDEIDLNPRARSARLRTAIKL